MEHGSPTMNIQHLNAFMGKIQKFGGLKILLITVEKNVFIKELNISEFSLPAIPFNMLLPGTKKERKNLTCISF